jgi:hypothetical protein
VNGVREWSPHSGSFVPMAVFLCLGTLLWFKIDASRELRTESFVAPVPVPAGGDATERTV